MNTKCWVGIDVGSAQTKAVLLSCEPQTIWRTSLPTGWNPRESAEKALHLLLNQAGRSNAEIIVATGYGRVSLPFAQKNVTEISCHAKGASHLFPQAGVVIDIGGQDSKVISVENGGSVRDFVMNDKCAAGTGRFLQTVSTLLGMEIGEFCASAVDEEPCAITNMCAVFAETEIIGLLAKGARPGAIAAGVLCSIARRIRALVTRIPLEGECVFTGGLATSPICARMIQRELSVEIHVPEYPQYAGALGAALIARTLFKEEKKLCHGQV